mmetsp:Transcript_91025/g.166854  ORF Transcript_91025/g.166854 Transcript_91025/m.166854 type:complete len:218 (-) Transcript_91025:39-692(-)
MFSLLCSPRRPSVIARSAVSLMIWPAAPVPAPDRAAIPTFAPRDVVSFAMFTAAPAPMHPPAAPTRSPTPTSFKNSLSLLSSSVSCAALPEMPALKSAPPVTPKAADPPNVTGAATMPAMIMPAPATTITPEAIQRPHHLRVLYASGSLYCFLSSMSYRRFRSGFVRIPLASDNLCIAATLPPWSGWWIRAKSLYLRFNLRRFSSVMSQYLSNSKSS